MLFIGMVLYTSSGCNFNQSTPDGIIRNAREEFGRQQENHNDRTMKWEKVVDSIYKIADTNQMTAIEKIDGLISADSSMARHEISELHFMKGQFYYNMDSAEKSIAEFSLAEEALHLNLISPKHRAARAGAYLKSKQLDRALSDLHKAAEINHSYLWNIGNYYEIIRNRDSAIYYYKKLYHQDTLYYKFSLKRALELEKSSTSLLTELDYKDRERPVLLIHRIP